MLHEVEAEVPDPAAGCSAAGRRVGHRGVALRHPRLAVLILPDDVEVGTTIGTAGAVDADGSQVLSTEDSAPVAVHLATGAIGKDFAAVETVAERVSMW